MKGRSPAQKPGRNLSNPGYNAKVKTGSLATGVRTARMESRSGYRQSEAHSNLRAGGNDAGYRGDPLGGRSQGGKGSIDVKSQGTDVQHAKAKAVENVKPPTAHAYASFADVGGVNTKSRN